MGTILIILFSCAIPVIFLIFWLLNKFRISKATVSRAKIVQKRMWDGPPRAGLVVAPKYKPVYYIRFAFMIDNDWAEEDFKVPKKTYNSFAEDNEGILRHDYTDFISFEKFEK